MRSSNQILHSDTNLGYSIFDLKPNQTKMKHKLYGMKSSLVVTFLW